MKRIGILTFHRSINYGAFMQSYSLAQQLKNRYGEIVEIVDFEKLSKHISYHPKHGLLKTIVFGRDQDIMRDRFKEDLKLLPLSEKTLITDDYNEVLQYINGRYDIVVVGSDAVWAYNKGLGLENPYWLFGDQLKCEKFSYAASAYSLDQDKITEREKVYIADCLKSFTYIGVRDQETENLVKMCLPEAVVHRNCDPTILLDKPDPKITRKVAETLGINHQKKLVTIMMGQYEPIIYDVIKKMGRKDYEFVFLYSRMKARERFLPWSPRFLYDLSPFEWYHLYGAAYLNFTTFFHGTLLALKSNVPTITFDVTRLGKGYVSKIQQITSDLGLSDYYNSYNCGITKEEIFNEIDSILNNYEIIAAQIQNSLKEEAKKSISFFKKLDESMNS